MRILITNDDGIEGEGIATLVSWAKKLGEVLVVAPIKGQSGKSHAINLENDVEIIKSDRFPGVTAYAFGSTPADCVRYAYAGLHYDFDMVFSGINLGYNIGTDILYSGTAGAIFEAALNGARGIAFSTEPGGFEDTLGALDRIYDYITENDLFRYGTLYNVNVPKNPGKILLTRQGGPNYKDLFFTLPNGLVRAEGYLIYKNGGDLTIDADAVMSGYISVTPMTVDRTDYKAYTALCDTLSAHSDH